MSIRTRIALAAKSAAGRVAGRLGAYASATPPVVPGVGNPLSGAYQLPRDDRGQRVVESREALYGRVSTRLGPLSSNISTHPRRGLTPARIAAIRNSVYTTGIMTDWACLIEDTLTTDAQIQNLQDMARDPLVGAPFTVEPADASPEGRAVADYQQAVFDGISSLDRAMGRLLLGNAGGYALEDVSYADKTVRFPHDGTTVSVTTPTPVSFGFVHAKHTRWQVSDDTLELDTYGGFVVPPEHKFVIYESPGYYAVRNRGYMGAAIYLSMIAAGCWARVGVIMDTWGAPSPWGVAEPALWQDEKRRAEMLQALVDFGSGKPAIFTDDFEIKSSPASAAASDARAGHLAVIGAINLELSKLIIGSTLTSEISATGSYGASETHADTKQSRVILWEKNLSACVRTWMRAALRLAIYEIAPDGTEVGVNPKGLCAALGLPPSRILALCGRPTWRVQREVTPEVRMDLYKAAVNELGMEIDAAEAYREFGFARARDPERVLRGKPVTLSGDAATTSTIDANEGVQNPKPPSDPTPTPPSPAPAGKARTRYRASNGRFARKAA